MLQLNGGYSLFGVPYLTNEALDDYAEHVIADASPINLTKAIPLDVDSFLEFYLHLPVEYKKLSYSGKILGITAFDAGHIEVIDEKTNLPKTIQIAAGTVMVDNSLLTKRNETRLRFTLMHEAAH